MNALERILATVAGRPVDRRAVAPILGLYGARLIGCPLERYYRDPEAYVRGQSAVWETFQPDVLCAPLAFALIGAAFGSELVFLETQVPNIRRPVVGSVNEWDFLELPEPETDPWLKYLHDTIRGLATAYGARVPIAMVIPIPTDIPDLVMGLEAWLDAVLFDPAGARKVMDKVVPFYVDLVNGFFAAGATFVVMPCGLASPSILPREKVAAFVRPILESVLAQMKGPVLLHNVGAPLLPHLDLLAGLPAVKGFIVDERDDLAKARRVIGPEPVLFGGPDCARISGMTAARVEAYCLAVLKDRRADARFVLGTSGPDIVWDTPPENIRAMRQAAERFAGGGS